MPFMNKKKYGRYKKCGKMVYNDAAKALAMAKYLKSIVNVEYKRSIVTATASAITVAPITVSLCDLSQGNTSADRDGAHAKFVSIRWAYHVIMHASATATAVRCMIVRDNQTNEAAFAPGDLINDVTLSDGIVADRQQDHLKRFTVLYDKVHTLNIAGNKHVYKRYYKKLNLPIQYDGNVGDITDQTQKSLHLVFLANESTNTPTITFDATLRFIDN